MPHWLQWGMSFDFEGWSHEKIKISEGKSRPNFYEREVWFCSLGINIGREQNGKGKDFLRPILVIKKFNGDLLWAVPLTRTHNLGIYYFTFSFINAKSTAVLSQIRLIDSKRLQYKIGTVNTGVFVKLKEKLKFLLE